MQTRWRQAEDRTDREKNSKIKYRKKQNKCGESKPKWGKKWEGKQAGRSRWEIKGAELASEKREKNKVNTP